jgi:hypothetical protein
MVSTLYIKMSSVHTALAASPVMVAPERVKPIKENKQNHAIDIHTYKKHIAGEAVLTSTPAASMRLVIHI